MFFIRCCSSQLWKKNSLPNDAFLVVNRRCWPGKQGRGTEEWMLTLTFPPRHLPFLKVAKKSYFKKSTIVPIYSWGLRSNFHFVKFRKTEVWQLTLALPRHLSREKITRSVLRFQKISAFNVTKIPPCLFHVPKNPVPTFYELMLHDFLFSFLLP